MAPLFQISITLTAISPSKKYCCISSYVEHELYELVIKVVHVSYAEFHVYFLLLVDAFKIPTPHNTCQLHYCVIIPKARNRDFTWN